MRRAVLAAAATLEEGGGAVRDVLVDGNRLRRMDRFGRSGVLAGARVLSAAGVAAAVSGAAPDPRFGVVVGTAYGCRDSVTQHERLLAAAGSAADLAPSVFAATVHNAVCGELAILFGLGGPAETLVSGRTAGLEALVLAASRVARGDADRMLVVAAEGIDEAMHAAFLRENPAARLIESSAAVLLEAEEWEEEEEEEISLSKRKTRALFMEADLTFGAASQAAWAEENPGDFLEGVGGGGVRGAGDAVTERLGATGLWEIATDLVALGGGAGRAASATAAARSASAANALSPHSPSKKIRNQRYSAHDVHGSSVAVTLAFPSFSS